MRKRLKHLTCSLAVVLVTVAAIPVAQAANRGGEASLSPVIGGITFDGTQHLATRPFYGIRGGYNLTDHLGIEGLFDYARTQSTRSGGDADFFRYGGELLYHFMPDQRVVPYLAAGYAGFHFNGPRDNIFHRVRGMADYGLGLKFFLNENMAIRGDVRHLIYHRNHSFNSVEYSVGLYLPFGGAPAAARPVSETREPAATAAPPAAQEGQSGLPPGKTEQGMPQQPAQGQPAAEPSGAGAQPPGEEAPVGPASARESEPGKFKYCITLNILFDIDKAEIRPEYQAEVARVAEFLKQYPDTTAVIEGHSDNIGSVDHNMQLSQRRAESVVNYLVEKFGIDRSRLSAKGLGPWHPQADNATEAGKQKNRRIEAVIDCALTMREIKPPDTLCLRLGIQFDTGKADIKPQYEGEIARVAEYMKKYPTTTALVEGHTDNVGSRQENMQLSRQRAENVVNYLVERLGIDRSRLAAQGYGPDRRIAYNSTAEGRQMNRRITVVMDCVLR